MASVLKTVLALRHRIIPPLSGFSAPNAYLDLRGSPFYLAVRAEPWKAAVDAGGRTLPRRAAVNSFGASGANAHVVIEEYLPSERGSVATPGAQIIALSARDAAGLARQAVALRSFVRRVADGGFSTGPSLADIAVVLQTGRTAMEHRLAFVATDLEELANTLSRFVEKGDETRIYRGVANGNSEAVAESSESTEEAIAEAWVGGARVDWEALHAGYLPVRTPLPTYAFDRERHWIERPEAQFDEQYYREVLQRLRAGSGNGTAMPMSVGGATK
jgi:acyl transferase domain-containing protein